MLEENEFLSDYGIRSLSRVHKEHPYVFHGSDHQDYTVRYEPADSETSVFGGNSNWRGPVWFPINYLLIKAMEQYHHFYGEGMLVQCPSSSGQVKDLRQIAGFLRERMIDLFRPRPGGKRPCHGTDERYPTDPAWKNLILYYEYFDGDNGRGVGASHQTGWTALVANLLLEQAEADPFIPAPERVDTGKAAKPPGKVPGPTSNTKATPPKAQSQGPKKTAPPAKKKSGRTR